MQENFYTVGEARRLMVCVTRCVLLLDRGFSQSIVLWDARTSLFKIEMGLMDPSH